MVAKAWLVPEGHRPEDEHVQWREPMGELSEDLPLHAAAYVVLERMHKDGVRIESFWFVAQELWVAGYPMGQSLRDTIKKRVRGEVDIAVDGRGVTIGLPGCAQWKGPLQHALEVALGLHSQARPSEYYRRLTRPNIRPIGVLCPTASNNS